ncbi:hypothetical protein I204_02546 [Kwoniella mangroviensis CBS 8886]|nr:hypothetical protein I204_02546 [Kwoniella mangroviensis CBS 8886]
MPGPLSPYITPPPSLPDSVCSSRRSSLNDTNLEPHHTYPFQYRRLSLDYIARPKHHCNLSSRRSSFNDISQPAQHHFFRRHSGIFRPTLNARVRLPPLPAITDCSGGEDAEGDDDDDRSIGRADKRRRVTKGGKSVDIVPSPRKDSISRSGEDGGSTSPSNQPSSLPSRNGRANGPPTLAHIKPIGFAASREAKRDDGTGSQALPSPVVMGFDFKTIDEDQLKTVGLISRSNSPKENQAQVKLINEQVRDTISIKEQQQALIAARRREVAQSQPSTPKELTFKGWAPKDPENPIPTPRESFSTAAGPNGPPPPLSAGGGVGRRREKTRDKVEKMSIVTSATERDVVPGSKSAPLNQGLASQQASPREPPSGSQTAVPPHTLPPIHGYGHHSLNGLTDPHTAPLRRGGEGHEFARQQGPSSSYYNLPQTRPLTRPFDSQRGPSTGIPSERRDFSVPSTNLGPPRYEIPSPRRISNASTSTAAQHQQQSNSPISPRVSREIFLAPFNQLYDLLSSTDSLRYNLQDLHNRYEVLFQQQLSQMTEFKSTANASNTLLGNLQQSADSLKEMVRYEVERKNSNKDREIEELRERLRRLEERGEGEKKD